MVGSTWDVGIVTTYEAIGRSVLNYAAPFWTSKLSQTHWTNLQTAQNVAIRVAS